MWSKGHVLKYRDVQRVSTTNPIKRKDADECREHVEDVVQAADPSVQRFYMLAIVFAVSSSYQKGRTGSFTVEASNAEDGWSLSKPLAR